MFVLASAGNVLAQDLDISSQTAIPSYEDVIARHAEAIAIGRSEYVAYTLLTDNFTTGRFKDKTDEEKTALATRYFDGVLRSFITGNDNGSMKDLVERSPGFSEYLTAFPEDFILLNQLEIEMNIAEQNAIQAEQNAIQAELRAGIAEQNAIQADTRARIEELEARRAALLELQEVLRAHSE